jgi:hypothetical protein
VADVDQRGEDVERQCQDLVQELTILQTRGSELCKAIVGPLTVRGHLLEGMQIAAICHTEMVGQLTRSRRRCLLPRSPCSGTRPL